MPSQRPVVTLPPRKSLNVPAAAASFQTVVPVPEEVPVAQESSAPAGLHLAPQPTFPSPTPTDDRAAMPETRLAMTPAEQQAVPTAKHVNVEAPRPGAGEFGKTRAPSIPTLRVRRKVQDRLDGRKLVQKTVYLSPEDAQRLAVYCATHGYEQSDAMSLAIGRFLDDPEAGTQKTS